MSQRFDEIAQRTDQARQRVSQSFPQGSQSQSMGGGEFQHKLATELQQALRDLYEIRDKVSKSIQTVERLSQDVYTTPQWQGSGQGQQYDQDIRQAVADIASAQSELAREVKQAVSK